MAGLRFNTLFLYFLFHHLYLFFLSFLFNLSSFWSLYFLFSIFSFSLCWSLLACPCVINFNFISCPSCHKANVHKDWAFWNEAMPIWKEDDKSSWEQYHIILLSHIVMYWIWSLLDSDQSLVVTRVSPPIFGLKHCCRFRKRMQLNMGSLRLNLVSLLHFPSTLSFLPFLFLQFLFLLQFIFLLLYFLLQLMLILTGLSLCHRFPLHFMSLMHKKKGTFIKIERFKMKPCTSQKKMTRVWGSNIT